MTPDPTNIAAPLFVQLENAWNNADGGAFGQLFADETDFVDIRGTHHHGNGVAMGHGHQAIFDTIYKGSTIRYQLDDARALTPKCVLALATATLDAPGGPLKGAHGSRITAVITDQGDRWTITAFHNTLIADDA